MTVTAEDTVRRDVMENFIRRTGWSIVLKDIAEKRWGRDVRINIAERGTFQGIPAKGFTNTETGTIYMREEILDGIEFGIPVYSNVVNTVVRMLIAGEPINREILLNQARYYNTVTTTDEDIIWRIAQTIVAAYGVFGHEYCHAAYSEHTGRMAFQMGLEDLRGESLWMAQDPIRARQGLRACAAHWVTHDASPMEGDRVFDLSKIRTHSDMLHLYLLIAGRGRIGVLDDQSVLVTGVEALATEILGYDVTSDADDIIDRYLETAEDPSDAEGVAQRKALAQEFSALLPQDAKPPTGEIGCHCDPQDQQPGSEGESGEGDGAAQEQADDTESGESDGQGDKSGEEQSEGDESGQGQPGNETGEGEGDQSGSGDDASDGKDPGANLGQGDIDGQSSTSDGDTESQGDSGSGSEDTEDTDSAGPTVATNKGASDASDEAKNNATAANPDFITGTFGETIRPGHEDVTDTLDDSDAFRLTREQIEALAEILTEGLEEVADDESEAGWGISDEEGAVLVSRSVAPAKVASEVFSRQALTTRNRRLKR